MPARNDSGFLAARLDPDEKTYQKMLRGGSVITRLEKATQFNRSTARLDLRGSNIGFRLIMRSDDFRTA